MLYHVTIGVSNLDRAIAFYDRALAPLGVLRRYGEGTDFAAYGVPGRLFFWIGRRDAVVSGTHIAFTAVDRATVDAFHGAALLAGGRDNGAPGPRPHYHANYYAAFVLDPDGYNIEAVCHVLAESHPT